MQIQDESWIQSLSEAAGEPVSAHQARQMRQHWAFVQQWTPKLNLSSTQDPQEALSRHFCDSLLALRHLSSVGPIADIGSGAGFPGMPLAIMRPQMRVYLIEPRHRRGAFLQVVAARLGLTNVQVRIQKAEAGPPEPCASVVTRATFADRASLSGLSSWLCAGGTLVAQRTVDASAESDTELDLGHLFAPGRRYPYPLAGRQRACDVWIREAL